MDRCALFVDAGYLLADGAMAVHGTRNRDSVSWDYSGLVQLLNEVARDRTGLPLLRCYWYEATSDGRRTQEQDGIADIPGVKFRAARIRPGRREGVENYVQRDVMTLARTGVLCDAVLVSGDEDMAQVVSEVQDLGVRVTVVHISVEGNWTVSRALRRECDDLIEIGAGHLRPHVTLLSGGSSGGDPGADTTTPLGNGHGRSAPATTRHPVAAHAGSSRPTAAPAAESVDAMFGESGAQRRVPGSAMEQLRAMQQSIAAQQRGDHLAPQGAGGMDVGRSPSGPVDANGFPTGEQRRPGPHGPMNGGGNTGANASFANPGAGANPSFANPGTGTNPSFANPGTGANPSFANPGTGANPSFATQAPGPEQAYPNPPSGPNPSFANPPTGANPSFANPGAGGGQGYGNPQAGGPGYGNPPNGTDPGLREQRPGGYGQPPQQQQHNSAGMNRDSLMGGTQYERDVPPSRGAPPGHDPRFGPNSGENPGYGGNTGPNPTFGVSTATERGVSNAAGAHPGYGPPADPRPDPRLHHGPYTSPTPRLDYIPPGVPAHTTDDAVRTAHREGSDFAESIARDAPMLWLEAVLARRPRMPSDLEARLLQGSALPIDYLLRDDVRDALRSGFWDALERART